MTNTQAIAILIGALLPIIITLLKQAGLNPWWNLLICVVTCAGAGVLTVWARGELDWSNFAIVSALIFTAAEATYAAFWANSGLELLNNKTSIVKEKTPEA